MHVADSNEFPAVGYPANPKPTQSLSMNSWRNGADVVLSWTVTSDSDGTPRLKVATDAEELFDYRIEGWKKVAFPNSGSKLTTDKKQSFSADEVIHFMSFSNDETKRGVMLWMEPLREEP